MILLKSTQRLILNMYRHILISADLSSLLLRTLISKRLSITIRRKTLKSLQKKQFMLIMNYIMTTPSQLIQNYILILPWPITIRPSLEKQSQVRYLTEKTELHIQEVLRHFMTDLPIFAYLEIEINGTFPSVCPVKEINLQQFDTSLVI